MTLLNSCQVLKSLACVLLWCLQLIAQLNRFLALHALVEGLGIWRATFGLKFPILLNWVRFRPGICDGGATSSAGRGASDRAPTQGCLGLAPSRLSKQCGMDILPIFLLRLGSSLLMWIASFASLVIWEGSLSNMLKSLIGTSRLYDWSKIHYNCLLPTGNSSPAPRFYGLPKIHKANCPMHPIVSACGTATYQLAKFLTKSYKGTQG